MDEGVILLIPKGEASSLVKEGSHLLVRALKSQPHVGDYLEHVKVLIVKLVEHSPLLRLSLSPDLHF